MNVPSIKGTAFESAHQDVNRLLETGRLSRERLEARLHPQDLEILAHKVSPADWYPIDAYARLVELLADLEAGAHRNAYFVARGIRAAERLSNSGIYQQLDASADQLGSLVGRIVITLSGVIYNFTRWSIEARPDAPDFTIRVAAAAAFPEVSRFATQGFVEFVASRVIGTPVRIESSRPSPDCIIYRSVPE